MSDKKEKIPTLEELEAILNAGEEPPIEILPNGEVRAREQPDDSTLKRQLDAARTEADTLRGKLEVVRNHLECEGKKAREKELEYRNDLTIKWWQKGHAKMAEEALDLLDSDYEVTRVRVAYNDDAFGNLFADPSTKSTAYPDGEYVENKYKVGDELLTVKLPEEGE